MAKKTTAPTESNSTQSSSDLVASERVLQANGIVKNYVITSMGLGLVPVPLFDLGAVIATQIKMVHSLSKAYEVPFKRDVVKSLIMSLLSGALGVGAVMGLASLAKSFPVVGSLVGGATAAILSGALTYAVGRVFTQHFEQGGTLFNFNAKQMREHFKRELQEGKEVAQNLENAQPAGA